MLDGDKLKALPMKQLYLKEPNDLRLRETPDPEPGPGEVIVDVLGATTCGTDLKTLRRGHPKFPMPTPFGHEFSGIISKLGDGVTEWDVGSEVMCAPTAPCGSCSLCRRGLHNLCPTCMDGLILGAFAEKVRVPAHIVQRNLFPKPPRLDFYEAALMEPLACAVYGQQQLPSLAGKSVVIVGAGPIGLLHQMLALQQRPAKLILVGRRAPRLSLAREIGADEIVDAEKEVDLAKSVFQRTQNRGADVVIECTGQPQVWVDSIRATGPDGTTLLFGGCKSGTQVPLPFDLMWNRALRVFGVFHFTPQAVAESREHLCSGRLPVKHLITEVRPMSDFLRTFEDLAAGRAVKYGIDTSR
jgi:L-iditol 2-dehydrogenase